MAHRTLGRMQQDLQLRDIARSIKRADTPEWSLMSHRHPFGRTGCSFPRNRPHIPHLLTSAS